MQLSGLIEKLQSLFSPSLLISSVTPLICFIIFNAALMGWYLPEVNGWVQAVFPVDGVQKTLWAVLFFMGILIAAYGLSSVGLPLREILEGRYLGLPLERRLRAVETARFAKLMRDLNQAAENVRQFREGSDGWDEQLREARSKGNMLSECNYPDKSPARIKIQEIAAHKANEEVVAADDLVAAVNEIKVKLEANSTNIESGKAGEVDSIRLDGDHVLLRELIEYARTRAENQYISLINEREFNFSIYSIKPTPLGNIAESVRGYAQSRYAMNLEFFWTPLQKVLQTDSAFFKTVQDAKTQLDFAVSMFWLTAVSTVLWCILLPLLIHTYLPFLAVATFGPLITRFWYFIAVQNYRSFADMLRSSIDLFRFELLKSFKISLPSDVESERLVWDKLKRKLSFGEDVLLSYDHN
jgi:hypothetical protein